MYPVEINSLAMRTKGAALATGSNWISNYIVVQATPPGVEYLGWKFYLIWAFFNAIFVPVCAPSPCLLSNACHLLPPFREQLVWLVYPETANRKLEDIDRLYRENPTLLWVFRNREAIQTERPKRFIQMEVERQAAGDGDVIENGG